MASQTEICNLALRLLGQSTIASLEDDLPQAITLNGIYEIARKAALRSHYWKFAKKRKTLPALSSAPEWGYAYQYQLPEDYLRLVEVSGVTDYQVEGLTIVTDAGAPLYIRYIKDATDPAEYDALFVEALAGDLAAMACEDITGSNTKRQIAEQFAQRARMEAKRVGAMEDPSQDTPDVNFSWLTARN